MLDTQIQPAVSSSSAHAQRLDQPRASRPVHREDVLPTDRLDLGAEALQQSRPGEIRRYLVDRIRAEIAGGTYLADEKINVAVDRLFDELQNHPEAPRRQSA